MIIYEENEYINKIDLHKKTYIRECDDYKIVFDFEKNEELILLKKENMNFNMNIDGHFSFINNIINIEYNNGNEIIKIVVHLL